MINQDEWEWLGDRHRSTFQMVFHGWLVKYSPFFQIHPNPIGSMYGIFTYVWLVFMVNVGKYNIPYMDPMGMKQPNLVMDAGCFQRFLVSGIFNPKLVCLRSLFFYKLGGKGISAPTSHDRFKKTTQLGGGFHRFL